MIAAYLNLTITPIDLILTGLHSSVRLVHAVKSPKEYSDEDFFLGGPDLWSSFVRGCRLDYTR
jgi:hypothetical protein